MNLANNKLFDKKKEGNKLNKFVFSISSSFNYGSTTASNKNPNTIGDVHDTTCGLCAQILLYMYI